MKSDFRYKVENRCIASVCYLGLITCAAFWLQTTAGSHGHLRGEASKNVCTGSGPTANLVTRDW